MHHTFASFLALVTGTLLVVGCGSSTFTPAGRTTIASVPQMLIPTTASEAPAIVHLPSGGFVACALDDEARLSLQRRNDDLSVRWSTPVHGSTFGVTSELHGTNGFRLPDPAERLLSLTGAGNEILMITYRAVEDAANAAIGRRFDATTGALIDTAVLFTSRHAYAEDPDPELSYWEVEALRRCHLGLSPDSSRFVIYAYAPASSEPDIVFAVVDRSMKVLRTGEATARRAAKPSQTSVRVGNDGTVVIARVENKRESGGRFLAEVHGAAGSAGEIATPEVPMRWLGTPRIEFETAGPVLFARLNSVDGLAGVAIGRLDPSGREATIDRVDITPEMLEAAIGTDELTAAWLHPIIVTEGPTRYTLVIERRIVGSSRVWRNGMSNESGFATVGRAIVLGLDAGGRLRWSSGIDKTITFENYTHGFHEHFGGLRAHLAADGRLHLLYRNWFDVGVRRIDLASGTSSDPDDDLVIEASAKAIPITTTATWLRDDRFVMLSKHGFMATDVTLNVVDY